jgi:nucleoside-diphosphate-sugar epimerase
MTSHSKDAPGGNAQIILVTGATGNQGSAAASRLLTAGWRVCALTGDPASRAARALAGSGAEVTAGDLTRLFDQAGTLAQLVITTADLPYGPVVGLTEDQMMPRSVPRSLGGCWRPG